LLLQNEDKETIIGPPRSTEYFMIDAVKQITEQSYSIFDVAQRLGISKLSNLYQLRSLACYGLASFFREQRRITSVGRDQTAEL